MMRIVMKMNFLVVGMMLLGIVRGVEGKQPNIVIILADDMGFSDVGCYGGEIETPNIDGMAKGGVRLSQFYNMARCCPTRASLQTGLYPHEAGVGQMNQNLGVPAYQGHLNDRCATVAEILRGAGYATAMVGKWHLSNLTVGDGNKDSKAILNYEKEAPISPPGGMATWPYHRGYEQMWGTIAGVGSYYNPWGFVHDDEPMQMPAGLYYTNFVADKSAELVGELAKGEKPFFLFVAPTAPHWPIQAPEDVIKKYQGIYERGWDALREERYQRLVKMGMIKEDWKLAPRESDQPKKYPALAWEKADHHEWEARRMATYAAMIDILDQGIGRVLHAIDEAGVSGNTLVLFMSDNGACAENVQGQWYDVPSKTRDGRRIRVGNDDKTIMAGPEDSILSYGPLWANLSNTPFRSFKHYTCEGGIAAPFIARWPGHITRDGAIDGQVGDVIDILPTCLDAAGVKYPEKFEGHAILPVEGVSLLPELESGKEIKREPIFWEHEGNRAVRVGDWKLQAFNGRPWHLYNMVVDRTELHDLAGEEAGRVKEMKGLYEAWAKRCGVESWPIKR
jgi:arylsulfatase